MKVALLILVWSVLFLAAGGGALHLWLELEGTDLGMQGWLALGLGVGLSLVLGIGLMALVFFSARRGYDELGGGGTDPGARDHAGDDKAGHDAAGGERDRDDAQR
jgi:hypothetical protein